MKNICWKLEEKYSIEDMEKFQKAMTSTKGNFMQFISDRDNLFELDDVWNGASLKDEEDIFNLTQELLTTQDSFKRTQCTLQESNMEI